MPALEVAVPEDHHGQSLDLSVLRPSVGDTTAHNDPVAIAVDSEVSAVSASHNNGNLEKPTGASSVTSIPQRTRDALSKIQLSGPSFTALYGDLDGLRDRGMTWIGVVLAIAAGVPLPIIFYLFGEIIGSFPPEEHELVNALSKLLGVAAAYFVLTTLYMSVFGLVGEKIALTLRRKLLRRLLDLDQTYYDTHDLDVNGMLTAKVETIQAGTSEKVGIFIQSLSYFVVAIITGFVLNAKLTGLLLAAAIPSIVLIVGIGSTWISRAAKKAAPVNEKAAGVLESAIRGVRIVQAFSMIGRMTSQHEGYLRTSSKLEANRSLAAATQLGAMFFVAYAINALAYYVGSDMVDLEGGAGTVYAVILLVLDGSMVVGQFAPFLEVFSRAASSGDTIRNLIAHAEPPNRTAALQSRQLAQTDAVAVSARGVAFYYPARPNTNVLQDFNLDIQSGTVTAICGTSGGGKSTLVSLLSGAYDNYTGSIIVGGVEARELSSSQLRSAVSMVEQESVLFTGTIYDNIRYGTIGQTLSDKELAARFEGVVQSVALDFIEDLPLGIHTVLDNTFQLSGGQKQRICLARALMRNAPLLILDEPTSALDARSEEIIMQTVRDVAASGATVLMIAHRLSTVLDADMVAVVSQGRIVEQGSPKRLLEDDGPFRKLLQAQHAPHSSDKPENRHHQNDDKDCTSIKETSSLLSIANSEEIQDEENQPQPRTRFLHAAAKLYEVAKPEFVFILIALVACAVSGLIILGEAVISGNLIHLLNTRPNAEQTRLYCLLFFILACIALISYITSGSLFGVASSRIVARLQNRSLENILRQDMTWFAQPGHSTQNLLATLSNDAGAFASLSGVIIGTILTTLIMMVGGIVLSLIIAWKIAIVLLSAAPVILVAGFLRSHTLNKYESRRRAAYNTATGIATESCRKVRTVQMLGLESQLFDQYNAALEQPYKQGLRFTVYANVILAAAFAIPYFIYALAYWWGSQQVRNGTYSDTQFFIILPATLFAAQSAGRFFAFAPEMTRAKTAATSVLGLLDASPTIMKKAPSCPPAKLSDSSMEMTVDNHKSKDNRSPKIEFLNTSLSYPSQNTKSALNGLSLRISQGQKVALVGPSGAGKSTAIALLQRYFDPTTGLVCLDGEDLRIKDIDRHRSCIGLVSQEPDLFPGSIAYNVGLGARHDQSVSHDEIEDVCRRCGLHDFIQSLPEGYNTECSSSGSSKLSGGQQQRLCIARALIRNPEILLLDEPTSALDAISERQIQETLDAASQGRTTITVAHRLASIRNSDKIIVIDKGIAVEEGTHAELMRKDGLYASMASTQSLT